MCSMHSIQLKTVFWSDITHTIYYILYFILLAIVVLIHIWLCPVDTMHRFMFILHVIQHQNITQEQQQQQQQQKTHTRCTVYQSNTNKNKFDVVLETAFIVCNTFVVQLSLSLKRGRRIRGKKWWGSVYIDGYDNEHMQCQACDRNEKAKADGLDATDLLQNHVSRSL